MCRHWPVDGQHCRVQRPAPIPPQPPPPPPPPPRLPQVPAGSLPRTMEVILRNDQVETVRPGDKACFTGMLVVVPDVAALT